MNWYTGSCGGTCISTPDGLSVCPSAASSYQFPSLPCYSLVGQIGNGTPFLVGKSLKDYMSTSSGELYLGVNDDYYPDNTGSWTATICLSTKARVGACKPIILYDGKPTPTEAPVSVEAGQKIPLSVEAVGSGVSQPWSVLDSSGNPSLSIVGGFSSPLSPCSGSTCGDGVISLADLSQVDAASFYFVAPGQYTVKYSYAQDDGTTASETARFDVDGPKAMASAVTTDPDTLAAPLPPPAYRKNGTIRLHFPIRFYKNASGISPSRHKGYFFWVQLVENNYSLYVNGKLKQSNVENSYSLDNTFPYVTDGKCYLEEVDDDPGNTFRPTDKPVEVKFQLNAWMYLMWEAGDTAGIPSKPDNIPVPLGSLLWYAGIDGTEQNGSLLSSGGAGGIILSFEPIGFYAADGFPVWTNVDASSVGRPPCP